MKNGIMSDQGVNGLCEAQQAVTAFHLKFGFAEGLLHAPTIGDANTLANMIEWSRIGVARAHLITEELSEVLEAWDAKDIVELADGLGDLLYVVLGTAVAAGIDLAPIFAEIQISNMSKTMGPGLHPLKGENFYAPMLKPLLRDQGFDV